VSLTQARGERGVDDRLIGWTFVGIQFALLALIILVPKGEDWGISSEARWVCRTAIWLSIVVMLVGALGLGRGLTPVPIPNARAQLRTGGLYRFVRHPIYSGLLLFAISAGIKSGSLLVLVAAVALVGLINVKARWEERRLVQVFADYAAYAERTPRFVPFPNSRR
jgi:protein-S-isoprenylcysteine O-methyltransferase Ste14